MNENFNVNSLVDIETEKSLLRALMEFDNSETVMALVKLKESHFYDEGHQEIFAVLKELESRGFKLQMEVVRAELMKEHPGLLDALMRVALVEPVAAVLFAVESLEEWQKKRELFRGLSLGLQELQQGSTSLQCGSALVKVVDEVTVSHEGDTPTHAELKERFRNEPPIGKIPTGINFIDVKSGDGPELGQLIAVMGGPDAGKTSLVTQILRNATTKGHRSMFFPLEFSSRKYIKQNEINEKKFNLDLFLIEDRNTDLYDIEAKIKEQAMKGVKVFGVDSQMVVTVSGNFATAEAAETEKFRVFQRLAIRYELLIYFVCQQSNAHTAGGEIAPMGSKKASHFVHEIWYVQKQKLTFTEFGDESNKGFRDFMRTKSKTGGYFSKPMFLDPRTFEFAGVQFDEGDPRSTKTVGSGRPKAPVEEVEYVMEDADGNELPLDKPVDKPVASMQGSFEMPGI